MAKIMTQIPFPVGYYAAVRVLINNVLNDYVALCLQLYPHRYVQHFFCLRISACFVTSSGQEIKLLFSIKYDECYLCTEIEYCVISVSFNFPVTLLPHCCLCKDCS